MEAIKHIERALHEEIVELCHHGYSISESFSLPIGLRKFHLRKIEERLKKEAEAIQAARTKKR